MAKKTQSVPPPFGIHRIQRSRLAAIQRLQKDLEYCDKKTAECIVDLCLALPSPFRKFFSTPKGTEAFNKLFAEGVAGVVIDMAGELKLDNSDAIDMLKQVKTAWENNIEITSRTLQGSYLTLTLAIVLGNP